MIMIGESAGFTLRYVGLARQVCRQITASGVDGGLNVSGGCVDILDSGRIAERFRLFPDSSSRSFRVTPAIRPNCLSSGVATDDAMTSGLAPGKVAATEMVGKSICGRRATGKSLKRDASGQGDGCD